MFAKIIVALIIAAACSRVATGRLNTTELLRSSIMSEAIQTKRCPKCKQVFLATIKNFYRNRAREDGLSFRCKQCQTQGAKRSYQCHKQQILQRKKLYNKQYCPRYYKTLQGYLRHIWKAMLTRCNKPNCKAYKYYGGRGIQVKFACFKDFYDYIVKELKIDPRGLTIDRIDNDGHYEKGNIRFITHRENCQNRQRKGV